ncbi:MAG: LysM peptidoglycan-binding domain-containing protein [Bacteroidales bacterium]|nr:LysM peptidoglycan-binding domain-containing protein [Lachnoclostridium sp.]MCM1382966.1 LysM peptidoglycan-binding domain-containing protein [Lachnoclostridium sp.]MCM1463981.1 LysM peptidoglycan-binding domain-containing protein [Bacteroidales bacterium]
MRTRKNIADMTDRELRYYKRKLRRQQEIRRKVMMLMISVCLITVCAVSYRSIKTSAGSGGDMSFKYYTDIAVQSGDTLWDIAGKYMDSDRYKDKNAYISEVCSINHIGEDALLYAGQHITVPYYSSEFIR